VTSPFDTIESAHDYLHLLLESLEEARHHIAKDMHEAGTSGLARRLEALRLVDYKLSQLRVHMSESSRLLNDLRTLRRLLLAERGRRSTPLA